MRPNDRGGELVTAALRGDIALRHVDVELGGRRVLKDVSFDARAGSRTAVIGPTAAGKTQLLYLLTGLIDADGRERVEYDGRPSPTTIRSRCTPRSGSSSRTASSST